MKSSATLLAIVCICLVASLVVVSAPEDPILVVFYEEGCPSCEEMDELLAGMTIDAPETAIARYEITEPGSLELLAALAKT